MYKHYEYSLSIILLRYKIKIKISIFLAVQVTSAVKTLHKQHEQYKSTMTRDSM